MKITISGATGLLWSALTHALLNQWHKVTIISRSTTKSKKIFGDKVSVLTWDKLNQENMYWCEVCIHLAGTSIMTLPWTQKTKNKIRNSRIDTTKKIVSVLPDTCHTFMCASAVWYYPPDTDTLYDANWKNTDPKTFLEKLCVEREDKARMAKTKTRRVIHIRTWLVIWPGTFEDKLITSIKWFGGIILWSGSQSMPQVTKHERVSNVLTCINNKNISWPINNVSKNISYKEYVYKLSKENNRPVWTHIPSRFIRWALWEASQLFLWSQKIQSFIYK